MFATRYIRTQVYMLPFVPFKEEYPDITKLSSSNLYLEEKLFLQREINDNLQKQINKLTFNMSSPSDGQDSDSDSD